MPLLSLCRSVLGQRKSIYSRFLSYSSSRILDNSSTIISRNENNNLNQSPSDEEKSSTGFHSDTETETVDIFKDRKYLQPHRIENFSVNFLGTSASYSRHRSVSSLSIYFSSKYHWLFDTPDGTLREIFDSSRNGHHGINFNKIFISRLDPLSMFGLPMILVAPSGSPSSPPLEVYGPPGISHFIQSLFGGSGRLPHRSLIVHELCFTASQIEILPEQVASSSFFQWLKNPVQLGHFVRLTHKVNEGVASNKIEFKRLFPDENGFWPLVTNNHVTLLAGLVGGPDPIFGYVLKEIDKGGSIIEKVCNEHNLTLLDLKKIKHGQSVQSNVTGEEITALQALENISKGRKLTLVLNGGDGMLLKPAAIDSDLLICNAVLANKYGKYGADTSAAKSYASGNFWSENVAKFADEVRAKRLALTKLSIAAPFFSRVLKEVKEVFSRPHHVTFASDGDQIMVPLEGFSADSTEPFKAHLGFPEDIQERKINDDRQPRIIQYRGESYVSVVKKEPIHNGDKPAPKRNNPTPRISPNKDASTPRFKSKNIVSKKVANKVDDPVAS